MNENVLVADQGQLTGAVTVIVTVPACGPTTTRLGLTAYSHGDGSSVSAASTLIRGSDQAASTIGNRSAGSDEGAQDFRDRRGRTLRFHQRPGAGHVWRCHGRSAHIHRSSSRH